MSEMDSKGRSICVVKIPYKNKIITRENLTFSGENIDLTVFGVKYKYGIHAEVFCIMSILGNSKYLKMIEKAKVLEFTIFRYTKTGKFAISSKPCDKCIKVLKNFKKTIFDNKIKIVINYFENTERKRLCL